MLLFFTEICHVDASDDCNYVLVATSYGAFFLWVMEKGESVLRVGDTGLKGEWHKITIPPGVDLPSPEAKESRMSSVFYDSVVSNKVFELSCYVFIVTNNVKKKNVFSWSTFFPFILTLNNGRIKH